MILGFLVRPLLFTDYFLKQIIYNLFCFAFLFDFILFTGFATNTLNTMYLQIIRSFSFVSPLYQIIAAEHLKGLIVLYCLVSIDFFRFKGYKMSFIFCYCQINERLLGVLSSPAAELPSYTQ